MRAVAICSTHTPAQLAGPHVIATVRDYHELIKFEFPGDSACCHFVMQTAPPR